MNKTTRFSATLAAITAAGAGGYAVRTPSPMTDDELVAEMLRRSDIGTLRTAAETILDSRETEADRVEAMIRDAVEDRIAADAARGPMPARMLAERMFRRGGEDLVRLLPGYLTPSGDPSVPDMPHGPAVWLRRDPVTGARWTMLGSPGGGGQRVGDRYYPMPTIEEVQP